MDESRIATLCALSRKPDDVIINPYIFNSGGGGGGYRDAVLADSPVSYWRLGEGGGSTAVDEVGAHAGTYIGLISLGAAGLLTGDANTAISRVQGDTGTVDCGNITVFDGAAAVTVECWVQLSGYQFQPFATLVEKGGPFEGFSFSLGFNSNPAPQFYVQYNGGVPTQVQSSTDLWDGQPHHVAGRYDGVHLSIWIDGAKDAEAACTGVSDTTSSSVLIAPHFFGSGTSGWSVNGIIDEVALYDFALSDARLAAHFAAGD